MKVLTFLGDDFDKLCRKLADLVVNNDYEPDVILGVLTGGGIIGRIAYDQFQQKITKKEIFYSEVKLQRVSTKIKKKGGVKKILPFLPLTILNFLRVAEVYYFELKAKFTIPQREGTLQLNNEISTILKQGRKKILIIDDCIDTGWTLKIIFDYLKEKFPNNEIKIAVATISHHHPVITADFKLYNRVLLRFPWAYDVKEIRNK